jgi:hypothetical protein
LKVSVRKRYIAATTARIPPSKIFHGCIISKIMSKLYMYGKASDVKTSKDIMTSRSKD